MFLSLCLCTNLTDSRTFIADLSKIVAFLDWCKDSQISLHWFQEENESCCCKTFSSIFQAKQSLNHLPDRGLGLSMYLRFRIENVLIFGTQVQVLPIIPKKLERVFLRFIWLFLFPSLLIIKEGKCSLKRTQDYILTQ